ncbi:hypothetical protein BU23DRAFT_272263 [Bimuria novae-zelandiae CBS 107.79]|uniref:Uncharacterized protein n=1 Tax=Bimuria novae-zelandiae CBS 107.79 TaxID=1447943 RepID=A0A6A5VMM2_9PLEO|nr:hypothetical protein BU23DRAFT_272263 [Bimuria novae-zelandiae CBS 107.79]
MPINKTIDLESKCGLSPPCWEEALEEGAGCPDHQKRLASLAEEAKLLMRDYRYWESLRTFVSPPWSFRWKPRQEISIAHLDELRKYLSTLTTAFENNAVKVCDVEGYVCHKPYASDIWDITVQDPTCQP